MVHHSTKHVERVIETDGGEYEEEVIVKVQRENLLDLFRVDLWNINLVAMLADRFDPQTEAALLGAKDSVTPLVALSAAALARRCLGSEAPPRLALSPRAEDGAESGACFIASTAAENVSAASAT